jgi:hypothetical protein
VEIVDIHDCFPVRRRGGLNPCEVLVREPVRPVGRGAQSRIPLPTVDASKT